MDDPKHTPGRPKLAGQLIAEGWTVTATRDVCGDREGWLWVSPEGQKFEVEAPWDAAPPAPEQFHDDIPEGITPGPWEAVARAHAETIESLRASLCRLSGVAERLDEEVERLRARVAELERDGARLDAMGALMIEVHVASGPPAWRARIGRAGREHAAPTLRGAIDRATGGDADA
jgi:hypothetical protein